VAGSPDLEVLWLFPPRPAPPAGYVPARSHVLWAVPGASHVHHRLDLRI